jgi:hypothetical protein
MSEVVVTRYELDIADAEKNLEKIVKGMGALDKSTDAAEGGLKDLSGEIGSAADKVTLLEKATKKGASALTDVEAAAGTLGKELGGVVKNAVGLTGSFGKVATAAISLGRAMIVALGPVGIIITAVVAAFAGLVKIFAGTQEGADRLNRILEPLKAGLAATFGLLQTISKVAVDTLRLLFNIATFNFSGAADAFDDLKESATGAVDAVANFGNTLSNALETGARLAKIKEDLADIAIEIAKNEGRINREFQEQLQIANNVNASAEEREAAAREAIRLQEELTAFRLQELDLLIEQLELKQSLNDTTKEELLELVKLQSQREQIVADQLQATRRVNNTINAIQKQAADKAIAEAKRRADEEKKRLEEIGQAEVSLAKLKDDIANRSLERSLDEFGRRALAAERGAEQERKAAEQLFDKLAQLNAGNKGELERIEQERSAALLAIRRELNAKLDDIEQKRIDDDEKKRVEELDKVRQVLTAEDVLRREAIDKEFDLLVSAAERRITNEEELTETLVALQKERQRRLDEVLSDADVADIERQQKEEELLQKKLDVYQNSANQIESVVEGLAAGSIKSAEDVGKALIGIALEAAEKQALIAAFQAFAVETGQKGLAGIATGLAITAIIKAAFGVLRSQIAGSFYEGGIVGKDGGTKMHNGRDGYLIRAHQGEHIMPTDKTKKYLPYLEMMRDGQFEKFLNTTAQLNSYGTRATSTTAAPGFNDRRIVGALSGISNAREQRKQTELLALVASGLRRGTNARYTA